MRQGTGFWFVAIPAILFVLALPAGAGVAPDAKAILEQVDRLYRADSSEAEITMKITTPDWSRELKLRIWSLGMKKNIGNPHAGWCGGWEKDPGYPIMQ